MCSFHDYILAGFVHCNCASSVPEGKFIIGGKLRLTPSRVYGRNPFGARVTLALDMMRDVTRATTCRCRSPHRRWCLCLRAYRTCSCVRVCP